MELTLAQAKEYLASLGITLPDFVAQILVDHANGMDACLIGAGYPTSTALLIKLYLMALLSIAQGDKYISSQTAPSGASQSFRYKALAESWRGTLGLLRALDKSGCAIGLIPPDPTQKAFAGMWVAKGGCMVGDS